MPMAWTCSDKVDESESGENQPGLVTSLSFPSFQKILQANDSSGTSSPDGYFTRNQMAGRNLIPRRQSSSLPTLDSQTSSVKSEAQTPSERADAPRPGDEDPQNSLFNQVYEWLQYEKSRQRAAKASAPGKADTPANSHGDSAPVDNSFSLAELEKILMRYATFRQEGGAGSAFPVRRGTRRRQRVKGLRRSSASESDYPDVDLPVPNVEAVLDNTKTLAYSDDLQRQGDDSGAGFKQAKDNEDWVVFKKEIVRLAHTLRIKGWRRVPMENGGDIGVTRLSGALTNAVYVVTPPKDVTPVKTENGTGLVPRKPPPKLLLRIYGPQVDHLIDRENELQILRRLGRKNIGPRVLGTFNNGRFEEYFEARPLTPRELRIPETSTHIAKRMRELHEGIELLPEEREGGPMVLKNWDKWVDRCEQVTNWLDMEILSQHNEVRAQTEPWRRRGLVCGVAWPVFRTAVDNYRKWLIGSCGGAQGIKQQLVFSHNDTQYGNLLRMEPSGESPLLLPANEHKQLVVIDFEYASANTPGFEFANHFTEWCYNYHDPDRSWACNNRTYPKPEEQRRFIAAYLSHQPRLPGAVSPSSTPPMRGVHSNLPCPSFRLDAGAISNSLAQETEKAEEDGMEANVQHLMKQQRLWRVINSAQWVAWGIVQAKVPGMEEGIGLDCADETSSQEKPPVDADVDDVDGFDYLAYAHDRAMFFWADLLALQLVDESQLPAALVEYVKTRIIEY